MAKTDFFWELGRRIAEFRKARSWSQERLSEKAGVAASYIAHIEIGSRKATLEILIKLAETLDIPLWRIITDDRLTPNELAREAAGRELSKSAHGLDPTDVRSLATLAVRLQTATKPARRGGDRRKRKKKK